MFEPQIGDLFYARCTRVLPAGSDFLGRPTGTRTDNSYSNHIFRLRASDEVALVGEVAWSQYRLSDKPVLLLRSDYTFTPVAADVFDALTQDPSDIEQA